MVLEGLQHPSPAIHSFSDSEAEGTGDQDRWPIDHEIVETGPILAADLQEILKPGGGDQGDGRPLPLEQAVGRHGRAVNDLIPLLSQRLLRKPLKHGPGRIERSRKHLVSPESPIGEKDQVGEGAPDIHADLCHPLSPRLAQEVYCHSPRKSIPRAADIV